MTQYIALQNSFIIRIQFKISVIIIILGLSQRVLRAMQNKLNKKIEF